jgi:DNA-binding response OmpR family regulator
MISSRKQAFPDVEQQFKDWGLNKIEVVYEVNQALEVIQQCVISLVFIHENMDQPWESLEMGLLIRNLQTTPIIFLSSFPNDEKKEVLLLLIDRNEPVTVPFSWNGLRSLVEAALHIILPLREGS